MIVYNVTVKIELAYHNEWLEWMTAVHIPEVLQTGKFKSHKIYRLLLQEEQDGITYAIQYFAEDMSEYFDYKENYAPALQQAAKIKFQDHFVAFRTLMKEV